MEMIMPSPSLTLSHGSDIRPPRLSNTLGEFGRAAKECSLLVSRHRQLAKLPRGDGHPVIALPGYGGDDGSMSALRYWLRRWNYQAEPWKLGRNIPAGRISQMEHMHEFQEHMLSRIQQRVDDLYELCDRQPISLIGWSLGGIYANAMAQREPEKIRRVISLGTPYGDPKGTAAWNVLKLLNRSTTPDHEQNTDQWVELNAGPRSVPTTVIYSPCDGIVSPSIARLEGPNIDNIEVESSHLAFAWNPAVMEKVAEVLARPLP